MTFVLLVALLLLIALLTLVSYAERIYTERGKFLSREFQENIEEFERSVEPRLHVASTRSALTMAVLEQVTVAAIAVLIAYSVFYDGRWSAAEIAEAVLEVLGIVVVFNRVLPFILFSRTRGAWLQPFAPLLRALVYLALPLTVVIGFCQSIAALTKDHSGPEPEHASEAVEALIEAGQEEGILEEGDRDLIHSVVEFGDKTVREVMKPRPEMVAVPADTTVEQLTELLSKRPFSRLPVYEGSIDNIVGIVHTRDLLQVPDADARARTVRNLMKNDVRFVPETKRVNDLLREMQRDNVRMEIVIDEYGAVAGLVTIEDLVEEIVGEIRDEHETRPDVVQEAANSYVMSGSVDVDRLDDLFGVRLEAHDATTVAGLVSEIAGRIPAPGETVAADGLRFEVLDSTDRKVLRVRVTAQQHQHRHVRA